MTRNILLVWPITRFEIHRFCATSEVAYGTSMYIRVIGHDSEYILSRFHCSKSRVFPLKQLNISRLELLGLLLSSLIEKIRETVDLHIDQVFKWTDSKIILAWLNESLTKLKTCMANRIAEILWLSTGVKLRHVLLSDNPADLVSNGVQEITELTVKY